MDPRESGRARWDEILFVILVVIAIEALLQFVLFLCLQGPSPEEGNLHGLLMARKEMRQ